MRAILIQARFLVIVYDTPVVTSTPLVVTELPCVKAIFYSSAVLGHSLRPAPMAHLYRLGLVIWGHQDRIPVGMDICNRGCAYTVLQTVQRHGVYSAEPLKSFEIRVGHSPGFGLPSILP